MEAAVLRCDGELAMRKGDNKRAEECFIRSKDWPLLEMLYLTSGQHDKLAAIINGINFSALNELAIGDASERTMALEQAGRPVLAYLNAVAYMSCGVNPDAVRLLTQLSAAAGAPRPYRQLNKDDDLAPNVLEAWHAAVAAASAEGLRAAKAQGSAAWHASGFGGGGETGPATRRADDDTTIIHGGGGAGGGGDAPWVTDNVLGAMMARGLAAFAAISLVSGYPTVASLPHSIGNAYMVLIAIAVECDEISLERANPYRARLAEAPK